MVTVRKYAQVVNPQINPNITQREGWTNIYNAIGNDQSLAYSHYTKGVKGVAFNSKGVPHKTYVYNYPWKITAHRFGFNIPSNARIKKVTAGVRMKSSKNGSGSTYPKVGFYIRDSSSRIKDSSSATGWHNGVYWHKSEKRLSTTISTAQYPMSGDTFYKGGYTVDNLNSDICGVDLDFGTGNYPAQTVYLMLVWMEVEYDLPSYTVSTNLVGTEENPYQMRSGVQEILEFNINQPVANVSDSWQTLKLSVPWGTEISGDVTARSSANVINDIENIDANNFLLKLKFNNSGNAVLRVPIIDYTVDKNNIISLTNTNPSVTASPIPSKNFYYNTKRDKVDGYDQTTISYLNPPYHKRHLSCFTVDTVAESRDDEIEHQISNDEPFTFVCAELDGSLSSEKVKLKDIKYEGQSLIVDDEIKEQDVPVGKYVSLIFRVKESIKQNLHYTLCIRPHNEGSNTLNIYASDPQRNFPKQYDVLPSYTYHIGTKENEDHENNIHNTRLYGERINFTNHRIATNLETGAFVLPCHVKDTDAVMIEEKSNIHMYKWEQVDYIGCVPLEHLHFDPKSTYKDKLLDSHYKNKRYMGKELATDEDIDLNVRLHPAQVTTIQGLIDMDKPIPINANHRCFEGDALNHRGWAEIYGIKSELTNPSWYKCSIDVKYLTHNLNSRFHINKGDKTFGKYGIPSLLAETVVTGSSLSNNQDEDFFIVDTDGTYTYTEDETHWDEYYDYNGMPVTWVGGEWHGETYTGTILKVEDEEGNIIDYHAKASETDDTNEILEYLESVGETVKELELNQTIKVREDYTVDDGLKNRFTLDEGQHIRIKSRQPLSSINKIEIRWASSKLFENLENAISRITRLIDVETGDVVFEYEYCDFDFTNFTSYTDATTDEVESKLSCRVIGRRKDKADYIVEFDDMIDLQSDVETEESDTELKYYGSNLIFELNNSHLKVIDEGYNGKEIESECNLEGKQYYWETYWENKNTGGENDDIIAYFNVSVQDSVLETTFADKYSSMYISPFPVSDKKILFTRNAEEGVIYYLDDDKEEFTYLIEPYYQYHNGVDLRNEVGSSIFNLNYGYKVIYLENGLVSLGINRLNGRMYLRKYDPILEDYVTLFNLYLNKYEDVNINSISDDRIELQASDTTIIMYRGHPYVIFKHELEDIGISTKSYKVYGQDVDGQVATYPTYYDLMNKDNLLPECVTKKLDDDCVSLKEEVIEDLDTTTIVLSVSPSTDIVEGDTVTYTVKDENDNLFDKKVCFLVKYDKDDGYDEIGCSSTGTFDYKLERTGAYIMMAVYVGDDSHEYAMSNEVSVQVGEPVPTVEPTPEPPAPSLTGDYVLTMSCPSTMTYRDGSTVLFTLTKGGVPVQGKTIEMTDFNYTNSAQTNAQGQVSFKNTKATSHPKKYKLGAKFWDGDDHTPTKQVYKEVTVKKGTPEFHLNHRAEKKGGSFSVNLRDKNNASNKLGKAKVQITVNGKKYDRVTNDNGSEAITINSKGTFKYICVFNGNKDYNKCKFTYREKVK